MRGAFDGPRRPLKVENRTMDEEIETELQNGAKNEKCVGRVFLGLPITAANESVILTGGGLSFQPLARCEL